MNDLIILTPAQAALLLIIGALLLIAIVTLGLALWGALWHAKQQRHEADQVINPQDLRDAWDEMECRDHHCEKVGTDVLSGPSVIEEIHRQNRGNATLEVVNLSRGSRISRFETIPHNSRPFPI